MNNELIRDPAVIAAEINAIKNQTSGILEAAFTYAKRSCFEIGKRLEEAKASVPFGEWGTWLEQNVSYSVSTANDLMRIYREFGNEQIDMLTGKCDAEIFEGLSQSQMVALFGLPKAMRAEFVEEHREELESGDMSVRDMKAEIASLKAALEGKEDELRTYDSETMELSRRRKEAETRATEAETRASAAEAAKKAAEKREKELQIRIEAIRKEEQKAAEERIREAVAAAQAEADKKVRQLTAQIDPRAAKISIYLETIGRAMRDINAVVKAMNESNAGSGDAIRAKCEAALMNLCAAHGWQV